MSHKPTLAIIGAGKLGIVLATLALRAGYSVYIAGSGPASKITLSVNILTPGAIASTTSDAISHADIVILALPLGNYRMLPVDQLKGKLVIDAMNYWWEIDGVDSEVAHPPRSSSEMVQDFLDGARVVKALSHMGYHHLLDESAPKNAPNRKAIAIAGDSESDTNDVASLVDDLGFDPVAIGPLARGIILEPGHDLFGASVDTAHLHKIIAAQL